MKRLLLLLLLSASPLMAADLSLSDGDVITFAGDSNMSQWRWVHYVADYLILRNPSLTLHIWPAARSGTTMDNWLDTPGGYTSYDEYSKRIYAMQPNYVFVMLGYNNPSENATTHANKMEDLGLNYIVAQNGATPIMFGPVPSLSATGNTNLGLKDDAVTTMAATHSWTNVRSWHDMLSVWTANYAALTDVNVAGHAGTAGHIIEAYLLMKDLGWGPDVSSATIDASDDTVTSHSHCTIGTPTSNAYSGVDFTRLDDRLPWAIDEVGYDGTGRALAESILPELINWQDYSITISNLAAGNYDMFCDGVQIGAGISNTTLASGWNMADLTYGPVFDQVQEVLGRIRDMQGVLRSNPAVNNLPGNKGMVRWVSNAVSYYGTSGDRGSALITAMAPARTELEGYDALIHTAAQPANRAYSVRLVQQIPSQRQNGRRLGVNVGGAL